MNVMEPIRDKRLIEDIKEYLKENNYRDYILFTMGIHIGLRISDLLKLRVKDVSGAYITIKEGKTKKPKRIKIPKDIKPDLKDYCKDKGRYEYLFPSREGRNRHITRDTAYKMMRRIGDDFGIDALGTHSLRKTYAYHLYKETGNLALMMETLNHTDISDTLRYMGVTQEMFDNAMDNFSL